ncbi:RagB/SusD family nutrient uptake outer membrane protein [Rhizosphaericola mali]|uniref:RagB/SusD family nutrient uptake outer membrane protein n=1 Tax=Rhizosphaericola mali TaxID=2545455 RepID=A0A5P2G0N9_9BACT|nr:RagB/SusD family nutrient uptake outer membrane protein [Rhizosphaericola mali]QES88747.1 RagB/SusD family nutrient uptake outer membrane protein [Rhizosphaericola mali]
MKHFSKIRYYMFFILLSTLHNSCEKKDTFLDKKPSTSLIVPTTLVDMQTLLDNSPIINYAPQLNVVSTDEYYITKEMWEASFLPYEKNAYIWAKDIFGTSTSISDWNQFYTQIFYANLVLDGLERISRTVNSASLWDELYGRSLFIRSFAFYNLAILFSPVYDSSTASTDLGIPLKLSANINTAEKRSSVAQTYDRIITDLKKSIAFLPNTVDANNRVSKPAAYALLSRIYLSNREYILAGNYADSCLQLYNTLVDYNTLNLTATFPFPYNFAETIYLTRATNTLAYISSLCIGLNGYFMDTTLYGMFSDNNDLRTQLFFTKNSSGIHGKRGYGAGVSFNGLATDEMYLIRAECNARQGKYLQAMDDLNTMLKPRWKTGTYISVVATSAQQALEYILKERRKQLMLRGLRWSDLRRLNKEGYAIVLKRKLGNDTYTLAPNSPLYTLPIPNEEILNNNIQQNER